MPQAISGPMTVPVPIWCFMRWRKTEHSIKSIGLKWGITTISPAWFWTNRQIFIASIISMALLRERMSMKMLISWRKELWKVRLSSLSS